MVCAAIFVALLLHTTRLWQTRGDWYVAGVGLVSGALLEIVATDAGLWTYSHPSFASVPAWSFVLWPTFMIGLPRLAEALAPTHASALAPSGRAISIGLALITAEIALLSMTGNAHPSATTVAVLALGIMAIAAAPSWRAVLIVMIGAVFGMACETWPVRLGIWTYPAFGPMGMPPWLAPGYAVFGLAVVHLGQGLASFRSSHRVQP